MKSRRHRRESLVCSFFWLNVSSSPSLQKLRERAGLRQADVCRSLNIADSTLRNWERGRKTLMLPVWEITPFLDRMAALYGCTREELIEGFAVSFKEGTDEK